MNCTIYLTQQVEEPHVLEQPDQHAKSQVLRMCICMCKCMQQKYWTHHDVLPWHVEWDKPNTAISHAQVGKKLVKEEPTEEVPLARLLLRFSLLSNWRICCIFMCWLRSPVSSGIIRPHHTGTHLYQHFVATSYSSNTVGHHGGWWWQILVGCLRAMDKCHRPWRWGHVVALFREWLAEWSQLSLSGLVWLATSAASESATGKGQLVTDKGW